MKNKDKRCICGKNVLAKDMCKEAYARFNYLRKNNKLDSDPRNGVYCKIEKCKCGENVTHKTTTTCDKCHNANQKTQRRVRYEKDILTIRSKAKKDRRVERLKLRTEVIKEYGEKCILCSETIIDFLCVDHISGYGNKERRDLNVENTYKLYKLIKDLNYPKDKYRCLCYNCNWKEYFRLKLGIRSLKEDKKNVARRDNRSVRRIAALKLLGGKCVCCGESNLLILDIDHINNNGSSCRKAKGTNCNDSVVTEIILEEIQDVSKKYQIMCRNCNSSKGKIIEGNVVRGMCYHEVLRSKEFGTTNISNK